MKPSNLGRIRNIETGKILIGRFSIYHRLTKEKKKILYVRGLVVSYVKYGISGRINICSYDYYERVQCPKSFK